MKATYTPSTTGKTIQIKMTKEMSDEVKQTLAEACKPDHCVTISIPADGPIAKQLAERGVFSIEGDLWNSVVISTTPLLEFTDRPNQEESK